MSQTWYDIVGSWSLQNSREPINQNFEALQSSFSGTTFPTSPVAGQLFFRTTDTTLWQYDGSDWKQLFDVTSDYGGLLPRSAGSSYPLTGDLYCGGHQLKNVGSPDATSDVATKSYVDTLIQQHDHDGSDPTDSHIDWKDLIASGDTANTLLYVASGGTLENKHWDADETWADMSTTTSYQDIASTDVWAWSGEKKLILYGFQVTSTWSTPKYKVLCDTNEVVSERSAGGNIISVATYTPSVSATYTWKIQVYSNPGGETVSRRFIVVL